MIDTLATLMFMEPMEHILADGLPVRAGNDARDNATGLYRLLDGDVIITVSTPARLNTLFSALAPDTRRPPFPHIGTSTGNITALRTTIKSISTSLAQAISLLEAVGVPIARVSHFAKLSTIRTSVTAKRQARIDKIHGTHRAWDRIRFSNFLKRQLPKLKGARSSAITTRKSSKSCWIWILIRRRSEDRGVLEG